jgi:hypothetical protein
MPRPDSFSVAPHGDNWAVHRNCETPPSSLHETKAEAIAQARELAQATSGELLITADRATNQSRLLRPRDPAFD